jgi:hypothetical protein
MVTDGQVKELRRLLDQSKTLATAARMTNMTEKTARQYRDHDPLPSQRKKPRNWPPIGLCLLADGVDRDVGAEPSGGWFRPLGQKGPRAISRMLN